MNEAELVGGALYDLADPLAGEESLFQVLASGSPSAAVTRAAGFEPVIVDPLRRVLPTDPDRVRLAVARGAGWVLGTRYASSKDTWELVASFPGHQTLPAGLNHTTAESLIGLITGAKERIVLSAPYVDDAGVRVLGDALCAATRRKVQVEIFEPAGWGSMEELITAFRGRADPTFVAIARLTGDSPFSHLKVVMVDGLAAYIGSANLTGAALQSQNLELGVIVRGPRVRVIGSILERYRMRSE